MAYHPTVLSQLLQSVPRLEFERLVQAHDGARRSDALPRWSQFIALAVGHLGQRHSLRDIEAALASDPKLHYHLGTRAVSKSALARANESLTADFYKDLFGALYARLQATHVVPGKRFRFKGKLFSLDDSLIDLSMKVFPWADVAPKKAAFKLHLGLDHDGLIPAFAEVTEGLTSEMETVDTFDFPKGSVLVFDRGYSRYTWHKQLTDKGLFWVTRARKGMRYEVVQAREVADGGNVISNQIVRLTNKKAREAGVPDIRRIEYRDPASGKLYVFITNHKGWSAQTVADIYKARWEVELFFKWIKQNLKIRSVLGHTINAVATQIFVALCIYLLIAYQKFLSQTGYGLQAVFRLMQLNAFVRKPIADLLCPRKAEPPDPQFDLTLRAA
jgi:putative transposase